MNELTPFQELEKHIWYKREDYAGFSNYKSSSGTKVRAYDKMILNQIF